MNKRRRLSSGQEVVLIYDVELGFIQQSAVFQEYRKVQKKGITHEIPIFIRRNGEISGLECFWILPTDIDDDARIEQLQRELIGLQLQVSEFGHYYGYNVPEKIQDKEIAEMAANQAEYRAQLVKEFGYDPLDYSWVEKELAEGSLEKNWFQFQREHKGSFSDDWNKHAKEFEDKFHKSISPEEAFDMSRKWKRYLIGAWNTIASQNSNMEDWKSAAKKFEKHHKAIETRMFEWTATHKDNPPMAKVIEPVRFRHGPYFNECVERVPQLFVDATCYEIKPDVILQVLSYDPQLKYIRLDFPSDIQEKIKPGVPQNDPCRPMKADYVIYISPLEVETHLEFLTPLDEKV